MESDKWGLYSIVMTCVVRALRGRLQLGMFAKSDP